MNLPLNNNNELVTIKDIQQAVAADFHMSVDVMLSRSRKVEIVEPRQIAIYICRRFQYTAVTIGRKFKLDHSTICHAYKKIKEAMEFSDYNNRHIERLIIGIKGNVNVRN